LITKLEFWAFKTFIPFISLGSNRWNSSL